MIKRSYKDGEFKAEKRSFNIYCTVYDSLVFIRENTIECANKHLSKCIAKTVLELSKDEIHEICGKYTDFYSQNFYLDKTTFEFWKKTAYHLIDSAKVI